MIKKTFEILKENSMIVTLTFVVVAIGLLTFEALIQFVFFGLWQYSISTRLATIFEYILFALMLVPEILIIATLCYLVYTKSEDIESKNWYKIGAKKYFFKIFIALVTFILSFYLFFFIEWWSVTIAIAVFCLTTTWIIIFITSLTIEKNIVVSFINSFKIGVRFFMKILPMCILLLFIFTMALSTPAYDSYLGGRIGLLGWKLKRSNFFEILLSLLLLFIPMWLSALLSSFIFTYSMNLYLDTKVK